VLQTSSLEIPALISRVRNSIVFQAICGRTFSDIELCFWRHPAGVHAEKPFMASEDEGVASRTSDPGTPVSLARMRHEYTDAGLSESELAPDWVTQFGVWLEQAIATPAIVEPNAMVLSTVDAEGRPNSRTVLLKGYDRDGLVFYTNYRSRKGVELTHNPYASLLFPWYPLHRQVIIRGRVERVERAVSEAYFRSRPRGAQLGAWASPQSEVIESREVLEAAWEQYSQRWPEGTQIPTPEHWGGHRVVPDSVEFWQGRANRLHDRLRYRRVNGEWIIERLAP